MCGLATCSQLRDSPGFAPGSFLAIAPASLRERYVRTLWGTAACGFYDQAHLAREWNDLVGRPPTAWLAAEELPFVQDDGL
jgi:hypothetical protein